MLFPEKMYKNINTDPNAAKTKCFNKGVNILPMACKPL